MTVEARPDGSSLTRFAVRLWLFSGVATVYRRQRRGHSPSIELLSTGLMVAGLLCVSALLQRVWLDAATVAGDTIGGTLHRCLISSGIGSCLLFLPLAALLGAISMPTAAEREAVQSELLTHLSPFDLALGRLLAGCRPLAAVVGLSCGFWVVAQAVWGVLPGSGAGAFAAILTAHGALACGLLMTAAISALFTTGRSPGQIRGTVMGMGWTALCLSAILLTNPQIQRMENPVRLIEGTLLVNPLCAVTTSYKLDLLRTRWLYSRSNASEFAFEYPPPLASAALFLGVALATQGLTALRLQRLYQR